MDDRTVPKIRTGPDFGTWSGFLVRDLLVRSVVRIFGPIFFRSGTWSGIWSELLPGPVRGTDFGPENPYRGGFFFGPVRGPEENFKKLKK